MRLAAHGTLIDVGLILDAACDRHKAVEVHSVGRGVLEELHLGRKEDTDTQVDNNLGPRSLLGPAALKQRHMVAGSRSWHRAVKWEDRVDLKYFRRWEMPRNLEGQHSARCM